MRKRTVARPPGPRGRWPVGNSYDYDEDRIGFLRRCQAEYGDVFSFSPSTVVVCDPELINKLFMESNESFLVEVPLFASEADSKMLVDRLDGWMRGRSLAWRGMTRSVIRSHGERIVAIFDDTLRQLIGREFDVMSVMRDCSGRLVADFCFGPDAEDVVEVTDIRSALAVNFMNSNLTFPKWLPIPSVRRAVRAEDRVMDTITAHVRRRRAAPHSSPEDVLDLLLTDDATEAPTEDESVALLAATMLASFGSPGAALAWVIRELVRRPDIYQRLRDEAVDLMAATGSLVDDRQLTYSHAFVKEVLRLYPPTWLMGRAVQKPCTLGGWQLQPGQNIMFSPYLVHRDPRWWSEPDELRPERWLDSSRPAVPHAYFPFGAGPRLCLGMHLGIYQLVTAASHLAACYEMTVEAMDDAPPAPHAVLLPENMRARITPTGTPTGEAATSLETAPT